MLASRDDDTRGDDRKGHGGRSSKEARSAIGVDPSRQRPSTGLVARSFHPTVGQFLRYLPIRDLSLAELREYHSTSVLEVGGGNSGLANYIEGPVVTVDARSPTRRPLVQPSILADAAHLPFKSESFDLVVSTDVLEHIPPALRPTVIAEMVRVSRRTTILAFPSGMCASRVERRFGGFLARVGLRLPDWLEEHLRLGLPTETEVVSSVDRAGASIREVRYVENCQIHAMTLALVTLPYLPGLLGAVMYALPEQITRWLASTSGNSHYRSLFTIDKLTTHPG